MECYRAVDVVYIEIEKAFDIVETGILLNKLHIIKAPRLFTKFFRKFFDKPNANG